MSGRLITAGAWGMLAVSLICIATGVISDAGETWSRVWPVLAFLLLVKIASDEIDRLGVFKLVAYGISRAAKGVTAILFALFGALAILTTALLSLDATVVLLTPIALNISRKLEISPAPFLISTIWIANIGSLFLPISNLTNLLAAESTGWSTAEFLAKIGPLQVAILLVTLLVVTLMFRNDIFSRYDPDALNIDVTRRLKMCALIIGLCIIAFGVAVFAGTPPWLGIGIVDIVLLAMRGVVTDTIHFGLEEPESRREFSPLSLLYKAPWTMAAFALGLFFLMGPLSEVVASWIGSLLESDGVVAHSLMAVFGVAGANAANNLPAYLALEASATSEPLLIALLLGVNAGPLLTPWGSLATLLWIHMCRERDHDVHVGQFLARSAIVVPLVIATGIGILSL